MKTTTEIEAMGWNDADDYIAGCVPDRKPVLKTPSRAHEALVNALGMDAAAAVFGVPHAYDEDGVLTNDMDNALTVYDRGWDRRLREEAAS